MLRFVARAFCLFVVLLPLSAAAQLPVPPHVNLHNGYIEVINHIQAPESSKFSGMVKLNGRHEGEVRSGAGLVLNRCCILAGSQYQVEIEYPAFTGSWERIVVTPRLCNIRGIPFGYAVVVFTGSRWAYLHATRVDTSCPVEK